MTTEDIIVQICCFVDAEIGILPTHAIQKVPLAAHLIPSNEQVAYNKQQASSLLNRRKT